jgi:hypothetical protein
MLAKDLNTSFENRITLIVHDLAGDHRSRPHPKHQVFQFLARLQSKGFIAVTPSVFFGFFGGRVVEVCAATVASRAQYANVKRNFILNPSKPRI